MIIEISSAALGGALLAVGVAYVKARFANGNGKAPAPHSVCPRHDVMEEKLAEGTRRFERIDRRLDEHTESLTAIKTSIGGLGSKLDTAISFLKKD